MILILISTWAAPSNILNDKSNLQLATHLAVVTYSGRNAEDHKPYSGQQIARHG